jgi:hypothetical protein
VNNHLPLQQSRVKHKAQTSGLQYVPFITILVLHLLNRCLLTATVYLLVLSCNCQQLAAKCAALLVRPWRSSSIFMKAHRSVVPAAAELLCLTVGWINNSYFPVTQLVALSSSYQQALLSDYGAMSPFLCQSWFSESGCLRTCRPVRVTASS